MLLFNQKVIKFSVIIIAFLLFSGCAFIQDPLGLKKIEQLRQKAESILEQYLALYRTL
jgi:exopolysaccharide biosynthesis protein